MNHEIARMIVYLYEFCGQRVFQRVYFGPLVDPSRNTEKESYDLFTGAQTFLNSQGYDVNGSHIDETDLH